VQWAEQLARLPGARRDAVTAALRHSQDTGWPASQEAVSLLVAYALGEITSGDYAAGILRSLGAASEIGRPAPPASEPVRAPAGPTTPTSEAVRARTMSREEAVQAYVTGQIPVGEFLRLARG